MDLQQFIRESLAQIAQGIEGTEKSFVEAGSTSVVNPRFTVTAEETTVGLYGYNLSRSDSERERYRAVVHCVDFDVAVHTVESMGAHGGAGIAVAGIKIGAGENRNPGSGRNRGSNSRSRRSFPTPSGAWTEAESHGH